MEYDDHQDVANAEKWAGRLPVPTYAIDDETAVKVIDGTVEVVSEGQLEAVQPLAGGRSKAPQAVVQTLQAAIDKVLVCELFRS